MSNKPNQMLACRVIHLIPHDGVGGVEVAARSMLKSNSLNDNFRLFLIAGKSLSEDKENIIESPFRSANNPLAYLRAIFSIYKQSPEVLVCSLWRSIPVGLGVKLFRPKTKLVSFLHYASTVHAFDKYLHKLMSPFCNAIWADSHATLNARSNRTYSCHTNVISFITRQPELLVRDKLLSPHFIFWGRLNKQKGVDRSINLIRALVSAGYNCKYEIWGRDDGEKKSLVKLVDTLELGEHVEFKGLADYSELQAISEQACFYLQLSRMEGMAMSVLEAMQFGLVPVVTPVGEIGRYCVDEINAIIVRDVDNLEGVIDILASIFEDQELFKSLQFNTINAWKDKVLYENDFIRATNELF